MKIILSAILLLSSTAFAGVKYETTNIVIKSLSTEEANITAKVLYDKKIEKEVPLCNTGVDIDLFQTLTAAANSTIKVNVKVVYVADKNGEVQCISDATIIQD